MYASAVPPKKYTIPFVFGDPKDIPYSHVFFVWVYVKTILLAPWRPWCITGGSELEASPGIPLWAQEMGETYNMMTELLLTAGSSSSAGGSSPDVVVGEIAKAAAGGWREIQATFYG